VDHLVNHGRLPDDQKEAAKDALLAREKSVSTGMEQGIAVPHATLEGLTELIAGIAIFPEGLDFQSLDGSPANIVVFLLVPSAEKLAHVRTLTEIARRLGDPVFRFRLLALEKAEQVVAAWQ
jgi:mannitol/fructose-specific phosphotransferase system IIA component (Ntr-type)